MEGLSALHALDVRPRRGMTSEDHKDSIKLIYQDLKAGDSSQALERIRKNLDVLGQQTPLGTILHIAARNGDAETVRAMIDLGADVNARGGAAEGTPLNGAASAGNAAVVATLIECGAVLDTDEPERNPLFASIHNGHTEVAAMLLEAGIDYTVRYTGESMTDMDAQAFAAEWGRTDIADLITKRAEQNGGGQAATRSESE